MVGTVCRWLDPGEGGGREKTSKLVAGKQADDIRTRWNDSGTTVLRDKLVAFTTKQTGAAM